MACLRVTYAAPNIVVWELYCSGFFCSQTCLSGLFRTQLPYWGKAGIALNYDLGKSLMKNDSKNIYGTCYDGGSTFLTCGAPSAKVDGKGDHLACFSFDT